MMNLSQEKALYHLTGTTRPDAATLATVQKLADDFPYFAPAQSLLAFQFRKEEHPMLALQTIKTALYFTNPFWLQYQLLGAPGKPAGTRTAEQKSPTGPVHPLVAESAAAREPLAIAVPEDLPKTPVADSPFPEATIPVVQPGPRETEPVTLLSQNMAIPTVEAVKEMMRNIDPAAEKFPDTEELLPEDADETEGGVRETGGADNKIASLLSDQLADFKKPLAPDAKLDMESTHEKLHMVDYFASQGIKVDLSAIPQDKLTTHLRKFTDWLRQMKQGELNAKDLVANLEMEQQVAKTAQISNETGEVITEAMAEVLEKQGQLEKAIEVYEKLSFINPEKSSYFASKIELLKGI